MEIQSYTFGKIIIDGKEFSKDMIIFEDKISENWRRQKGHHLQKEDLRIYFTGNVKTLIVGTGKFGMMKIDKKLLEYLENNNIETKCEKTAKAVEIYNTLDDKKNAVAALHLTC